MIDVSRQLAICDAAIRFNSLNELIFDEGLPVGYPGRYYTVLRNTGVIPAVFGAKIGSVVGNNFLPKQV